MVAAAPALAPIAPAPVRLPLFSDLSLLLSIFKWIPHSVVTTVNSQVAYAPAFAPFASPAYFIGSNKGKKSE